ncbi:hypothetical protein BDV12DRAFT_199437 [Aspergillus spectabilis]
MTFPCCTTPQAVCKENALAFAYANNSGKYYTSDLLYRPFTYPVIFTQEVHGALPTDAASDMKKGMKVWLASYYRGTVDVHSVQLTGNGKSTICCMVDFPIKPDLNELFRSGFLIPPEVWQIETSKGGECFNHLRLRFFNSGVADEGKEGCCTM